MSDRFDIEYLKVNSVNVLIKRGMAEKDACIFVDSLLSADICGISTHGLRMLPSYIQKIDREEFSFVNPTIVKQLSAFTIIDAQNTIGAISACYAVEIAIEQANRTGVHIVFSRNSNTFGAAFYYAEKIAEAGMIGFVCCNAPAAMPAFNGREVMLGTNPLAFAFPTKLYGNIVMDMATSVVAKSRFGTAKAKGETLEPGWALDRYGNPTTDPDEGIQGFVLPMAGFKGYEIAMMIDMLAGFLSGAGYLNKVGKFYSKDGACMNVGHTIVALNPELLYDGDFLTDADSYVERLKASKTIEGKHIVIPGENKKKRKYEAINKGVYLTPDVVVELEHLFGSRLL